MGKTSFLVEFARRHSKDFEFVYIDIYGMTNQTQLFQTMTRELISSYRTRDGTLDSTGWEILRSARLKLAVLQNEYLATSAIDDVRTLAPPTKKDIEIANKAQKKIEIRMCPDCGKPLKWIEKYARHYCYSCRKYLPRQRKIKDALLEHNADLDKTCPSCGQETSFNEKYSHYYCAKCKSYPFVRLRTREPEEFTSSDLTEVLELPQKIAHQKAMQVVVMFDEFQNLASFGSKGLLTAMRSRFESHPNVDYVFTGSDGQAMHDIFNDSESPFKKFAETIELGPIPADEMEKFLMGRFASAGGKLARGLARKIVALSGNYPGCAQRIAHELFHFSKEPSQEDMDKAIRSVIEDQSRTYEHIWEMTHSPLQRRYLIASVTEPLAPHGADFIKRYALKSRSHVQRAEKQLEAKGIMKDGEVVDPLFVLWLRSVAGRI
jgi:predicted RNA-binding Zn-ribbon protein involved in translation (DUF1610 family)